MSDRKENLKIIFIAWLSKQDMDDNLYENCLKSFIAGFETCEKLYDDKLQKYLDEKGI